MGWCLIAATEDPHWILGWLTNLYLFAQVAIGLGFVIFVHELGHFLAAKSCGVKCEKFYVGFDIPINLGLFKIPGTLFKFQWGETEYGVGAIPLGGYVKMLGQDDNPNAAEEEAARTKIEADDGTVQVDPRSYTAKSVPQRMLIISAGVIMNLIFAVIMGAVAYMIGVSYLPAQNGGTTPGSPAWQVDLPIDAKITQIGKDGYHSEHLRFSRDLMPKVMLNGDDNSMDFLIRDPDTEKEEWYTLQPSGKNKEDRGGRPAIGMLRAMSMKVSMEHAEDLGHYAAFKAEPPLQTGDKIVAVNGQKVEAFHEVQRIWATLGSEPITLTVERVPEDADEDTQPEVIKSVVPPHKSFDLGIGVKIGPISEQGVQLKSPAAEAGLMPGDIIVEINGEPSGPALRLADRMAELVGQEVELTIEREGEKLTKTVTPRTRRMVVTDAIMSDSPIGVDELGIAFYPTNEVIDVVEGSPADKAGMQPGDVLKHLTFTPSSEEKELTEARWVPTAGIGRGPFRRPGYQDTVELGEEGRNWYQVSARVRRSQPDTEVTVTYERDEKVETTDTMQLAESDTLFNAARGLRLKEASEVHQTGFVAAWPLGFRETKERIMEVFTVLGKLFTNKISPTNLAGAPMIVAGAVSEASQGYGRLLIFLTFLSCNLAVLNFLPIPVLDGGHMVFLAAEGLRGKPVDERLQMNLTFAGLILLLGLMVFVFALDIGRLAGLASYVMYLSGMI